MHVSPRGVWMPDEIAVLETAFGVLRKANHRGMSDAEFDAWVVEDLMESARDGCHDPRDLVQRCRDHFKDRTKSRLSVHSPEGGREH